MSELEISERVSRLDERLRAHTHLLGGLRINQEDGFAEMNQRLAEVQANLTRITDLLAAGRAEPDKV